MVVENDEEILKLRSQEYSVFLTDKMNSTSGSGILYYSGVGDIFYIFTCAHIIDGIEDIIKISVIEPIDRNKEEYKQIVFEVLKQDVIYSAIDEITVDDNGKSHSVDAAVIPICKENFINIKKTDYYIAEPKKGNKIFVQGFPGGMTEDTMVESIDEAYGTVLHNIASKLTFGIRIEDGYLDSGNRIVELEGFSGSPVWNRETNELILFGLLTKANGYTAYRAKVEILKMNAIYSIMKNHFNITMQRYLVGVSDNYMIKDISQIEMASKCEIEEPADSIYNQWLNENTEKVRTYIDDLKLQKAIDTAKEVITNENFKYCSKEQIKKHYGHLLYCYEICLLDNEFDLLEEELNEQGLLEGHDTIRWLTKNFSEKNFEELLSFTNKLIEEKVESAEKIQVAKIFQMLANIYTKNLVAEDAFSTVMDDTQKLIISIENLDTKALVYQMIGYVYGEHYKEYTKAIRCLNYSYQIGSDNAVLETLAAAYYFMAIENAVDFEDKVDIQKINKAALYTAREFLLLLLSKADAIYMSALMKRIGLIVFNTFFFLHDPYRVLKLYTIIRDNIKNLGDKEKRDIQSKYATILCEMGSVDLNEMDALLPEDKVYLYTFGKLNELLKESDFLLPNISNRSLVGLEKRLKKFIVEAEKNLDFIDIKEQMQIHIGLMNLYDRGRRIFKWNVEDSMEKHMKFIRSSDDRKLIISMENFLFESKHSLEETERKFVSSWQKNPSFILWMEILQFYKRNYMFDKADRLFEELFEKYPEYYKDEAEYIYRSYIDYIITYHRDLKKAIEFFLLHKNEMKDLEVTDFWELELQKYTNTFNDPERFEYRWSQLAGENIMQQEKYHGEVMVAYMLNLNREKAREHYNYDKKNPYFVIPDKESGRDYLTPAGYQFMVWQGIIPPRIEENWSGMREDKVIAIKNSFNDEEWKLGVQELKSKYQFPIKREVIVDAWGIYLIAIENKIDMLEEFDKVYVTHCSVSRMLEEICHYKNDYLYNALLYLEMSDNVQIQSSGFEEQLSIRNIIKIYDEPASAIGLAQELNCIGIIGEPKLQETIIDNFGKMIMRPFDLEELLS